MPSTTTASDSLRAEFAELMGESQVISDPRHCATYDVDGKDPRCVVYPSSAEQVAAVLKHAADRNLAVIPCSNLTKIRTGNPPFRYDVALSLKEMNRAAYYEPADLVVSVEPGMKFGDLQEFVGRDKLWLPLDPPGGATCSVGGILAANASGPLRQLYGSARDMVLGLRIATTEGKIIRAGGRVVKNVAGYDLAKLLIGSYGTLGVIVEATFKLYPMPLNRATIILPTGTLGIARDLRRRLQQSPLEPMRMVLLDREAATLARPGSPAAADIHEPEIWIEAGGSKRVIERYAGTLDELSRGAGISVKREQADVADATWSRIADLRTALTSSYPQLVILKTVLPIAATEQFISQAQQASAQGKLRIATIALVGVINTLRNAAVSLGGELLIELCPPEIKAVPDRPNGPNQVDTWGAPGDDFEIMRKVKQAWDPKGILAPGRFIGVL